MKTIVVHLITLLELGGAQGNTLFTVRHLNPDEFDAHLWCGKGAFWDEDARSDLGTHGRLKFFSFLIRPLNPVFDLLAIGELYFALRKIRPQILHTHSSKAGIVGRIAGYLAGVPLIIHTFHGFGFNNQQKPWTRFCFVLAEKFCARLSTKLIFVSKANWNEALEKHIGKVNQYELIRSGVDLTGMRDLVLARSKAQSKRVLDAESTVITTISAFKPQKNLSDFVRLAEKIRPKQPGIKFLMVGDGKERPAIQRQIEKANLQGTVHILGWQRDVASVLAATDIFVLTSLWEGLPRALVEACSVGIPAVCYDTDGVRDVLSNGGGFIVPQKSVDELVLKIDALINDPSLYRQKSDEAQKLIGIEFDIQEMVRRQEKLYKTLVK